MNKKETEKFLTLARKRFDTCIDAEAENRTLALEDLYFSRGRPEDQWPNKVLRQRELDGQPCLTLNRIPAFIRRKMM